MDPVTDPAAAAASVAASIVAESSSTPLHTATLSDSSTAFSLTLPKEPPDVAFERLCKVHQSAGLQQECQVCQRFFPNWYKLKQHLHTHADFRPYTCTYCDKTFRNYSKKSRHEKTHSGLKPYVCKICDKHVSRSEHLKRHLLTHTESHPFKCIHCEYHSRRLDCIRYHMKNKHPEKENPKILLNQELVDADGDHPNDASDILWQQYKDSPNTLALVTVRSPDQPAGPKPKKKKKKKSTVEQSASFPYPDNKMPEYPAATTNMLGQQINLAQFPPTLPPSMIPGFSGFTSLNHNIKHEPAASATPPNSHSNQPSVSHRPQQAAPLIVSSNGHQQKMHEANFQQNSANGGGGGGGGGDGNRNKFYLSQVTQPTLNVSSPPNDLEVPRNMCTICEKAFDCPSKLQRHQNTHAGIRPFKCEVCGKALSRPEHLKRHLMTHDPNKEKNPTPKSKSKGKSSKSTISTSAQALLSQATMVQAQSLQPQHQRSQDATVVVSRVKEETDDQSVLTCQVVDQKPHPLTVVATPALEPARSQPQGQGPHYIIPSVSQHQQQLLQASGVSQGPMISWPQVAVAGSGPQTITINAANGLPMAAAPFMVHGYFGAPPTSESGGGGGGGGDSGQATVMYQRPPIPANMIVNATTASSVCGPPVFPPIS